jgi:hypothetical protein
LHGVEFDLSSEEARERRSPPYGVIIATALDIDGHHTSQCLGLDPACDAYTHEASLWELYDFPTVASSNVTLTVTESHRVKLNLDLSQVHGCI